MPAKTDWKLTETMIKARGYLPAARNDTGRRLSLRSVPCRHPI
jgi:hypothetical protein